jgi:hypothetical protein
LKYKDQQNKHIWFSDFKSLHDNFIEIPEFENIIIGYDALLTQKLKGYEENLEKLKGLNQLLTTANNVYN